MDLDVVLECLWVWKLTYGLSSNVCFPLASGRPVSGLGWGRPATWIIRRKTDTASKAVGRGDVRQNPGESGTKASTVSWWRQVLSNAQGPPDPPCDVAKGAPLVRCQLLASEFYEALKRELRATSELGVVERAMVAAATCLCRHAATASITPDMMLAELRRAIDLLRANISPCDQPPAPPRPRPILCVIEGGLSKAG